MRTALFTAALMLSGCATTVADIKDRRPFISATTTKSVGALSGCFDRAWQSRSGVTNSAATETGFTMTLTYHAMAPLTAAVIDVADRGASRSVVVHAYKGAEGSKLRSEIEGCL